MSALTCLVVYHDRSSARMPFGQGPSMPPAAQVDLTASVIGIRPEQAPLLIRLRTDDVVCEIGPNSGGECAVLL